MVTLKNFASAQSHQSLQFSLKQKKMKIPKSEVAANALFANHRQGDANVYDVLYIIIRSSRECEKNVAHPIHV